MSHKVWNQKNRVKIRQLGFKSFAEDLTQNNDAVKGRIRAESFADFYSQPRMFYRSQTPLSRRISLQRLCLSFQKLRRPISVNAWLRSC